MSIMYTYPASSVRSEHLQKDFPQALLNTLHDKGIPLEENWIYIDETVKQELINAEWIKIAIDIDKGLARFVFEFLDSEKISLIREEFYFKDQKCLGVVKNEVAFPYKTEENNEDDSPETVNRLQIEFTSQVLSRIELNIQRVFDVLEPVEETTFWDQFKNGIVAPFKAVTLAFQLAGEIAHPIPKKELLFQAIS